MQECPYFVSFMRYVPVTRTVPVTLMPNQYLLDEYTKISTYWISCSWTGCPPARKVPAQIHTFIKLDIATHQFSSVAQLSPTLCDPMNRSTPGLPVYHQLLEFTQTHAHRVSDAIQPSHSLSSPSPPAPNPSQHQGLFQWVNSSHQVAKVLEFQLQHQSFQWTPRTDLL